MTPGLINPTNALAVWRVLVSTPVGPLEICGDALGLHAIHFAPEGAAPVVAADPLARQAITQLEQYFRQADWVFTLPLQPVGTAFQQRVWRLLRALPCGQVRSYGEIARELGSSARAVGNACRRNPLPVVVPCHRVVAMSGLGGYDGSIGGRNMEIKRWLLRHEGVRLPYE